VKRAYFILLLMAFLAAQCHFAFAEDAAAPKPENTLGGMGYWKSYLDDGSNLITSPARWDENDWLKAGLVVGGTGLLYVFDERINNWAQANRNSTSDGVATFVKPLGNELVALSAIAGLYGIGELKEDARMRKAALLSFESLIYSSALTLGFKNALHRHRPSTGAAYDVWDGPSLSNPNDSFPSGHASTAFSVATIIAREYADVPYLPFTAYSLAALTALSRINDNDHWASDVFFSSASAYFIASAISRWHEDSAGHSRLLLLPLIGNGEAYLYAEYRF